MRAVMIERSAKDRISSPRSTTVASDAIQASPTTPIVLPLRGSIGVLGHTEWKVFRSFYLEMGIFLVDGVYKIMEVSHTLKAGTFDTELVLMYN